jgi:hypothetical protein
MMLCYNLQAPRALAPGTQCSTPFTNMPPDTNCFVDMFAGTACAGSWHAAQQVLSNKEAPGNAGKVKANVAAWKALGEEGQAKVKDPMTVLYKDVRLEVSQIVSLVYNVHIS